MSDCHPVSDLFLAERSVTRYPVALVPVFTWYGTFVSLYAKVSDRPFKMLLPP